MKVYTRQTEGKTFRPFAMTINIESEQEFIDMFSLFSYYSEIPDVIGKQSIEFKERHNRMTTICRSIYDALSEQEF